MWQYQCSDVATLWQHETHVRGSAVAVPWQCVMSIERYLRGSAVAVCHGSRKHVATPWQYTAMPKHFSFRGSWCRNVPNIYTVQIHTNAILESVISFLLSNLSVLQVFRASGTCAARAQTPRGGSCEELDAAAQQ